MSCKQVNHGSGQILEEEVIFIAPDQKQSIRQSGIPLKNQKESFYLFTDSHRLNYGHRCFLVGGILEKEDMRIVGLTCTTGKKVRVP